MSESGEAYDAEAVREDMAWLAKHGFIEQSADGRWHVTQKYLDTPTLLDLELGIEGKN